MLLTLRMQGLIMSWDAVLAHNTDPMPRIRLLRRCVETRACFAMVVGGAMLCGLQNKPTVRPTARVIENTKMDAALSMRTLAATVYATENKLYALMLQYRDMLDNKYTDAVVLNSPEFRKTLVYFVDYNVQRQQQQQAMDAMQL